MKKIRVILLPFAVALEAILYALALTARLFYGMLKSIVNAAEHLPGKEWYFEGWK